MKTPPNRFLIICFFIHVLRPCTNLEIESGGVMKLGPGLSFSWKRALGVTKAKRSIAKATGIPTTRSGRRNKLGSWMGMK